MLHATLAKADALILWADRIDSRHELARLIRNLVQSTARGSIELINFPADEGVQKPGWDGLVRLAPGTANPWVPSGLSAWELGTNGNPSEKATRDYNKRVKEPLGVDRSQSTYIFVTLRRWAGKDEWVRKRNAENKWREVRAYDADDLTAWLESVPSVHIWVSQLLGLQTEGALPLETYWAEWIQATRPPFNSELVIGGRQKPRQATALWLQGQPSALTIEADSPDDALSFFAAVVHSSEVACQDILSRAVVVDLETTWRILAKTKTQALK